MTLIEFKSPPPLKTATSASDTSSIGEKGLDLVEVADFESVSGKGAVFHGGEPPYIIKLSIYSVDSTKSTAKTLLFKNSV